MTDDRRPADDPTRALDSLRVPDQWADITARAARPEAAADPLPLTASSPTRRPYLVAAAVVAVLAIATGLVLTQRDDGSDTVVAGPSTAAPGLDPEYDSEELPFVPSGDATCAIGFDHASDPDDAWRLGPGPASPPVAYPHWTEAHLEEAPEYGVWNVAAGDQQAEIHVPGLSVGVDPTIDRFGEVDLPELGQVIVLFGTDWVMVRSYLGDEDWPCGSFTVTVTGGAEVANRDTALTLAQALVIEPRAQAHGDGPGQAEETTQSSALDGTELESRVPETEWVPVDLTEPPFGQRTWVLISIEPAGSGGSVTDPVVTEHGGGDGSGGAPALVMGDRTSVVLEGCGIVPLRTETRGVLPWLGLHPDQGTFEGCAGEVGDQHGQILKLLSLGVTPRFHETADGSVLVLANEEGTLVFRDANAGN